MKKHVLCGIIAASLLICVASKATQLKTHHWTVWLADNGKLYKNTANDLNRKFSVSQKPYIVSGKNVDWQGSQWNAQGTKNAIFFITNNTFQAIGMPNGNIAVPIPATKNYPIKSLIVFDHYAYIFSLRKLYVVDINAPAQPIKRTIILPTDTIVFPQKPDSDFWYNRPSSDDEDNPSSTTIWISPKGGGFKQSVDILDFDEMFYNPTSSPVKLTEKVWDNSSSMYKEIEKTIAPKTLELRLMGTTVIKFDISNPLKPEQID